MRPVLCWRIAKLEVRWRMTEKPRTVFGNEEELKLCEKFLFSDWMSQL